jgi:hypothetical protein
MRAAADSGGRPFFLQGNPVTDTAPLAPEDKKTARRAADTYFVAWEKRTALVKNGLAEERAASDVKTVKLRALRLAKEAADRESSRIAIKKRVLADEQKSARRGK